MAASNSGYRSPTAWVPTLYFAEGLPNYTVNVIAILMYQSLGAAHDKITHWIGLLGFLWAFKALWSPFVERAKSKKRIVIWLQILGGISLILIAVPLRLPNYFLFSMILLAVAAFASATHDIAADGLYIASLPSVQQARYAGWQGGFYNMAKFIALGGLPILQGFLDRRMGATGAWTVIFGIIGAALIMAGVYHVWALPGASASAPGSDSGRNPALNFGDVFIEFIKKPGIWAAIFFILLFRAGEAQITTIGPLFLCDARAAGGLGLSMSQFGQFYGAAGTLAFIGGTLLGGYFASWLGLRRAMPYLIIAMNLPNIAFIYLSMALPTSLYGIAGAIVFENFGFGFGYVGVMLFIMQVVSVGKYQMAHYAIGTGLMAMSLALFRIVSGDIQMMLGYQLFFVWAVAAAIPVLLLSYRVVPSNSQDAEQAPQLRLTGAMSPE